MTSPYFYLWIFEPSQADAVAAATIDGPSAEPHDAADAVGRSHCSFAAGAGGKDPAKGGGGCTTMDLEGSEMGL